VDAVAGTGPAEESAASRQQGDSEQKQAHPQAAQPDLASYTRV